MEARASKLEAWQNIPKLLEKDRRIGRNYNQDLFLTVAGIPMY